MDIKKVVGENLRGFRELQEYTREELCAKAKINLNHLGAIERGEENVTLETLHKLSLILGIEPNAFLIPGCHRWSIRKNQ